MSVITINLDYIYSKEITIDQFITLKYIKENDKVGLENLRSIIADDEILKRNIFYLYRKDLIDIKQESLSSLIIDIDIITVTSKGDEILSFSNLTLDLKNYKGSFNNFVNEFRELFPEGIKQGNQSVRNSTVDIGKKLTKFLKEYKQYDFDIILKATRRYINRCKQDDYKYIKISHYFIYKDGISALASECESIKEEISKGTYREEGDEEIKNTFI